MKNLIGAKVIWKRLHQCADSEIKNRWKEYVETLYDKDGKPKETDIGVRESTDVAVDFMGPDILESEGRAAIKEMKENKSGVDGIRFTSKISEKSGTKRNAHDSLWKCVKECMSKECGRKNSRRL